MDSVVQLPREFLEDFILHATKATKRIWIQAMVFEYGEIAERVKDVLMDGVRRGCDVRFQVDWNSCKYVNGDLRLLPELDPRKRAYAKLVHANNEKYYKELQNAEVKVTILNVPVLIGRILPIYKRNHTKLYIVDDVGWMGGVNFYDDAFNNVDFMVKFSNLYVVTAFVSQYEKVNENRPRKNYSLELDSKSVFLVDSGKHGDSIIYDVAVDAVNDAKESVIFVSQIVPEGVLLDVLCRKALLGVKVRIVTSLRSEAQFEKYPQKYFYDKFKKKIATIDNIDFVHIDKVVHAKLIIIDNEIALFGSHNFVEQGVFLGTEEIGMKTSADELVKQFIELLSFSG